MSISSGPYILVSRIGEGGMAEVFKALKKGPEGWEKPVALKRILPYFADNAQFIQMLSAEARLHAQLEHPNIVQILDFFRQDNSFMIALEYVPGKNLRHLVTDAKKAEIELTWQFCTHVLCEMLKALDYAHKRKGSQGPLKIVHRDISPQNVLISYDGHVKLSDFGIALANIDRDKTASGILKGKQRYLSPEQLKGGEIDSRADLFSCAVVLYELVVKKHPFDSASDFETMQRISRGRYESTRTLRPDLPEELHIAISKGLERKSEDRFVDAASFRQALLAILGSDWIAQGTENVSAIMSRLYPVGEVRDEAPLEKTPILSKTGTPLPSEISASESLMVPSSPSLRMNERKKIFLWGLGAFLALVNVFATWLWYKSQKRARPESSAQLPAPLTAPLPFHTPAINTTTVIHEDDKEGKKLTPYGVIRITGPDGAEVYLRGRFVGRLPSASVQKKLLPGEYIVSVKPKGVEVMHERVRVKSGSTALAKFPAQIRRP